MVGSGVLGNVVSGFGGEDGDEEDVVRIEMVKVMLYREVETGDVVFDGNIGRVAGDEHIVGVVNGDGGGEEYVKRAVDKLVRKLFESVNIWLSCFWRCWMNKYNWR